MKISIFSDTHCGFKFGEERGEDSFVALNEAIEKSLDSDLILIAGDIFDSRVPKQEVMAKTARILSKAQQVQTNTKFLGFVGKNKEDISPMSLRGIPIVAIHGTHERRSQYSINPIQALEHMGLLMHLHCSTAMFEIDGRRVAIHGLSGVPERYAGDVLKQWNPKPATGAINIFMFHQSMEPYIYSPLEPPTIKPDMLPKGFDLYILGHIHWPDRRKIYNGELLLTGSTIPTSLGKKEVSARHSIFKFDGSLTEIPLEKQRKIYWNEISYSETMSDDLKKILIDIPKSELKPIQVIKIIGEIPKGKTLPNLNDIIKPFESKAIIIMNKRAESQEFGDKVDMLRKLREEGLSPEDQGLKIVNEYLKESNCVIKIEEIFEHLIDGDSDLIFEKLVK